MFGIYRYFLAVMVVMSHLWAPMIGGAAAYAVWGFFSLSGYLMACILNEKYGFTGPGLRAFAINRLLRIYPGYTAACFMVCLMFLLTPSLLKHPFLGYVHPEGAHDWIRNLLLVWPFDQDGRITPLTEFHLYGQLVVGAHALRSEVVVYILMGLGLARRRVTFVWFAASLASAAWLLARDASFATRYYTLLSSSLPFSSGALLYHLRKHLPVFRTPWPALGGAVVWWAHVMLVQRIPGGPYVTGLYTSLIPSMLMIVCLRSLREGDAARWVASLDRTAGDLSYLIYLLHWICALVIARSLFAGTEHDRDSARFFVTCFLVANVVAQIVHVCVERPVRAWKRPGTSKAPVASGAVTPT